MYVVWRKRSIFTEKCLPFSGCPAPPLPSVMSPSRVAASRLTQQGSDLIVPAGIHCTGWIKPFLLLLKLNSLTQFHIACFIFLGVCYSGFSGGCFFFFLLTIRKVISLTIAYLSGFSKFIRCNLKHEI